MTIVTPLEIAMATTQTGLWSNTPPLHDFIFLKYSAFSDCRPPQLMDGSLVDESYTISAITLNSNFVDGIAH